MTPLLQYLLDHEPQFRKPRLAALYSDFLPLRTLNPDGYTANLSAWRTGFSSAARAGLLPSHFSITINQALLRQLNTEQWGVPLALGTVVRESLNGGEWVDGKVFGESRVRFEVGGDGRGKGWRVPGVGEVVGWGLRQIGGLVGITGGSGGGEDGLLERGKVEFRVVVLENLEEAAQEVGRRIAGKGRTERVFSREAFKETFEDVVRGGLSEGDLELLLKFLERDKGMIATDGRTICFTSTERGKDGGITLEDTTIASLKGLIKDINAQTSILEARIDVLSVTAKEAVGRKNRVAALAALRSKKLAESTLEKRHATLAQLEEVFTKIEQAADQVELMRVMEASTKVLTGLNKEVGGVERVDEVVEGLREQMSVVDEVGNVVAEAGQGGVVDEAEVDNELEEMERVEKEKKEAIERKERDAREGEREEKEKKEAYETKRRLDELAESEGLARERSAIAAKEVEAEKALENSMEGLKRMSLEPNPDGTVAQ